MSNQKGIDKLFKEKVIDLVNFSDAVISYIRSDNFDIFQTIADIKSDLTQWVKSGLLLGEIKKEFCHFILNNKLAKNWPDFCKKLFNQSHWYTDKLIDASKIVIVLIKKGFTVLPNCEAQARELVRFLPDYEYDRDYEIKELEAELVTKWQAVIDTAKKENKAITAGMVLKVVDPEKHEQKGLTIRLPKHIKKGLQDLANGNGNLTIAEYLEYLVLSQKVEEQKSDIPVENKDQVWEENLKELVKEHEEKNESQSKGFGKQPTKQVAKKNKQSTKSQNSVTNFGLEVVSTIVNIFEAIAVNIFELNLNTETPNTT